jgi:hypothetical protein
MTMGIAHTPRPALMISCCRVFDSSPHGVDGCNSCRYGSRSSGGWQCSGGMVRAIMFTAPHAFCVTTFGTATVPPPGPGPVAESTAALTRPHIVMIIPLFSSAAAAVLPEFLMQPHVPNGTARPIVGDKKVQVQCAPKPPSTPYPSPIVIHSRFQIRRPQTIIVDRWSYLVRLNKSTSNRRESVRPFWNETRNIRCTTVSTAI